MRWFVRRLRCERGIALVMAVGMMAVLGTVGVTVVAYTTSGQTQSNQLRAGGNAFSPSLFTAAWA